MSRSRPTLDDVAKAAGVSRSAASLAIRREAGLHSDTRAHILRVARALGYRPHAGGRALAQANRPKSVALVFDSEFFAAATDSAVAFWPHLLTLLMSELSAAGFAVSVVGTSDVEQLAALESDVVLLTAPGDVGVLDLLSFGTPCVLWTTRENEVDQTDHDSVVATIRYTANELVGAGLDQLHRRGSRRPAFVVAGGFAFTKIQSDHYRSWCQRMGTEIHLLTDPALNGPGASAAVQSALDVGVDGFLISVGDVAAISTSLIDRGLRIPADVSVVALSECDDDLLPTPADVLSLQAPVAVKLIASSLSAVVKDGTVLDLELSCRLIPAVSGSE